jgi:transposase
MTIPFKKDPTEFNQSLLFPSNIFDLLPVDHECYIYEDIFKQIDTSSIEKKYSVLGQHAYHPRLNIGILIYAYSHGIFSSRQIKKRCQEDLGFMFISHLNCPDFRVLSDFRKDHHDYFKECFKQSVLLAMEAGMTSLGHVSLDGSKFKANTSKHKAMSYGRLKEREKGLTEEIEALVKKAEQCDREEDAAYQDKTGYEIPEDLKIKEQRLTKIKAAKEALEQREQALHPGKKIDDKKQISFADTEARIMGKKGDFNYSYNGQITVDQDHQIIVGQHITQNANDKQEVKPALEEIRQTTGKLPDKMSLDNGYLSGGNLEALNKTDIDAYIATGKGEAGKEESPDTGEQGIKKSQFTYEAQRDCFVCPAGHDLALKSNGGDGKRIYQAQSTDCDDCPYRGRCCNLKTGEPRKITTDDKEPLRQAMADKMTLAESRKIYKRRKTIVEPVFGQIKENLRFRGFSVRGIKRVGGEFSLVCATHNIKKIVQAIKQEMVSLKQGRLIAQGAY